MKVELAACQVHVTPDEYASEAHFEQMLDRMGERLSAQRARTKSCSFAYPCLAVFPEMIGAFLPIAGRRDLVRDAPTTDAALQRVALHSLGRVAGTMLRGKTSKTSIAFLLSVAPEVRRIYRSAFARFSRRYDTWTVAGSALLPRNLHGDLASSFCPADARVYNTSYTFDPEGRHVGVARKVNLVPTVEDKLGLSPGPKGDLWPVSSPFGGIGTLICYDGFSAPHTTREPHFKKLLAHYDDHGCRIVAQPAANVWPWDSPWTFGDANGSMLRRDQWLHEGLFSQLDERPLRTVKCGVTAQLLGQVFDNHFDGRSHILERNEAGARVVAEARRADASREAEEIVLCAVEL